MLADYAASGLNVKAFGGVGQWRLAKEQLSASVQAYPCDPSWATEGFAMTCLEAMVAGCKLIVTDADALGELWSSHPAAQTLRLPVRDGVWVDALVQALRAGPGNYSNQHLLHEYSWSVIAERWEQELQAGLNAIQSTGRSPSRFFRRQMTQ
jgi:glycosyltransferase involved in cell wall biosynthesis